MMMGMLMVMLIGMLLFFAFVVALIWLSVQWLNKRKMLTLLSTPQQDTSQPYERGYQPSWSPPETSQEAGQQYPDPQPQYEQPRAQYPQPQELPPQS